jgi:hypothetical protein
MSARCRWTSSSAVVRGSRSSVRVVYYASQRDQILQVAVMPWTSRWRLRGRYRPPAQDWDVPRPADLRAGFQLVSTRPT